jgi:hypothetical protein
MWGASQIKGGKQKKKKKGRKKGMRKKETE